MKKIIVLIIFLKIATLLSAVVPDSLNYVSNIKNENSFTLSDANGASPLLISSSDYPGVTRAFKDLQHDIFKITGILPELTEDIYPVSASVIIAGTLGKSSLIDSLVSVGKIDTAGLSGKWEKFYIQTIINPFPGTESALVIVGSDKRGTIYGIYDISEKIGVSPWFYWADVPIQTRENIYVESGNFTNGEPAVKYRGIFINDEDPALKGWVVENFGKFNHEFYEHVYELILRLKGNMLWPAMWGKSLFEDDPLSDDIAHEYGIVIGTSHHEPMHRAHVDWSRNGSGDWNYETNEKKLQQFWKEGVERLGDKEALLTVGMRGDGDEAMTSGTAIPLLERIVADQREIIEEVTGFPAEETPQVWALYKEVQDYYDQGMTVPDDVTLLFADDNWGNIRRLPDQDAPERKGGYGVYYHFDYVGGPRSYRWLNTNPLPRIWEQMNLAYEHGVEDIWIVNVGDIKPMEFPVSFFLDMAWSPQNWTADKIDTYSELWAQQQFGEEHSEAIGDYLARYGKYNGRRKPELLSENTYSLANFNEAEGVLAQYKKLEEEVDSVAELLPAEYQDAYFQLLEHPVDACANLLDMYINLSKNSLYGFMGRASANSYGEKALENFERDADITNYYHKDVANGKWNHMMSQDHIGYTSWNAPGRNIKPTTSKINVPGKANMGVALSGADGFWPAYSNLTMTLSAFHKADAYVEIYNRGLSPYEYSIYYDTTFVSISPAKGIISDEQKLFVTVDWDSVPVGIDTIPVEINGPDEQVAKVYLRIFYPELPDFDETVGFVENSGVIAMEAQNFTAKTDAGESTWLTIPDLGRTGSGLCISPSTVPSLTPGGNTPHVSYNSYFFTSGTVSVTAYFSPTINYLSRPEGMRYGISFDDNAPIVESFEGDSNNGRANNIIVSSSTHEITEAGLHTLKYWMVDPGVVLQKIVVETSGSKISYLGAPEKPYKLLKEMFINAAKIANGDSSKVEIIFNEAIDRTKFDENNFKFFSNSDENEITETEFSETNHRMLTFSLQESFNYKQKVSVDYTPGSLSSTNGLRLEKVSDYIIQLGDYEDVVIPVVDDGNIYFEAEDGIVGSNWVRHADGFASNASYLMTIDGHQSLDNASSDSHDQILIDYKICEDSNYNLWFRANTPSPDDDSFWIKMDNGSWTLKNGIQAGNGWSWVKMDQFSLDTGFHQLSICMREDGAGLDKICLSQTNKAPDGIGGFYEECVVTETGINDMESIKKVANIYPNPATNELQIQSIIKFNLLTISNMLGEVVLRKKYNQSSSSTIINIESLHRGMHIIALTKDDINYSEIQKFIKE